MIDSQIPKACHIDRVVPKRFFLERSSITPADKRAFQTIEKITWTHCIQPENINIPAYSDEERTYEEIQVLCIKVRSAISIGRISRVVMRTIPYPLLIHFDSPHHCTYAAAHRYNGHDEQTMLIDELILSDYTHTNSPRIAFPTPSPPHLYALYDHFFRILLLDSAQLNIPHSQGLSSPEIQRLKQIRSERNRLQDLMIREKQFARQVEIYKEIEAINQEQKAILNQ